VTQDQYSYEYIEEYYYVYEEPEIVEPYYEEEEIVATEILYYDDEQCQMYSVAQDVGSMAYYVCTTYRCYYDALIEDDIPECYTYIVETCISSTVDNSYYNDICITENMFTGEQDIEM
jgi:hypothetical protein